MGIVAPFRERAGTRVEADVLVPEGSRLLRNTKSFEMPNYFTFAV